MFHLDAFRICMRAIVYEIEAGDSENRLPFLPYASQFWMMHARQGDGADDVGLHYPSFLDGCLTHGAMRTVELFKEFDRYESYQHYGNEEIPNTRHLDSESSLIVFVAFEGCTGLVSRHLKKCRQCLQCAKSAIGARNLQGAFFLAAHRGFAATAEAILDGPASAGARFVIDAAFNGVTALYAACLKGKNETVEFLPQRGAVASERVAQDYQYAFIAAAAHDSEDTVDAILQHAQDDRDGVRKLPSVSTGSGFTVFHICVIDGRTRVLNKLLEETRGDADMAKVLLRKSNRGNTAYEAAGKLKRSLGENGKLKEPADAKTLEHALKVLKPCPDML
ncbi:hypothetical protein ACHAQH_006567 [Verticillium albo-atrum]